MPNPIERTVRWADDRQARHPWLSFPFAVVKKFGDDDAGSLAALISYYGFFSLFPLLLALTTVLGFVLNGNPELQRSVRDSALAQFPVIGESLDRVHGLTGNWFALVVGLLGAVWAGLGVVNAAQNAMNAVWDVPRVERPNFLKRTLRGLLMLVVAGVSLFLSGFLAGLGQGDGVSVMQIVAILGSVVVNFLLFAATFRILTAAEVSWGDVVPGAVAAAVAWTVLLLIGQWFVQSRIRGAEGTYGTFAVVLGLLSWLYLAAQVTLFASEINVVRVKRLWPRSLTNPPVREADERSYSRQAKEQERIPPQEIDVEYERARPDALG
jgi:YihY family inner membrane protein